MINVYDYQFLTDQWEGPQGAAYNQTVEFCKEFGWFSGFDRKGVPVLTKLGRTEVQKFESGEAEAAPDETFEVSLSPNPKDA